MSLPASFCALLVCRGGIGGAERNAQALLPTIGGGSCFGAGRLATRRLRGA
ncbi:MAG: hypothetical protein IPH38_11180 [Candidatus Microthrix sp.]|nr:hypothetical protein [Candidatus Microthrix sp.]MBK7020124.1 hypothetical protein [Candidatus Microthrix sp.]